MGVTASSHPSAELTSTPDLVEARNHRPGVQNNMWNSPIWRCIVIQKRPLINKTILLPGCIRAPFGAGESSPCPDDCGAAAPSQSNHREKNQLLGIYGVQSTARKPAMAP